MFNLTMSVTASHLILNGSQYPLGTVESIEVGDTVMFTRTSNGSLVQGPYRYSEIQLLDTTTFDNIGEVMSWLDTNNASAGTGGGGSGAVVVPFSAAIPFNKDYSRMIKVVNAPISFTANLAGAIDGGGTLIKLYADGANLPTYAASFTKVSGTYSNVAGQINNILFINNAGNIEYSISLGAIVDIIPPLITSVIVTDAHTIDVHIAEPFTGTLGLSFNDGSALTVTARVAVGGNILRHTVSNTLTALSVVNWAYAPGDIADTATPPNAMASATGTATIALVSVPAGVIAEHLMHEANGNRADTVGTYTLSQIGVVGSAAGLIGNAAVLTPTTGLTNAALAPSAPGVHQPWSINMWIKFNSLPGLAYIFGRWDVSQEFLLYMVNDLIRVQIHNSADAACDIPANATVVTGTWYMITLIFTGGAIHMYINGVLSNGTGGVNPGGDDSIRYDAANTFIIGNVGGNAGVNALVQLERVFNVALSPTDLTNLFNTGVGI